MLPRMSARVPKGVELALPAQALLPDCHAGLHFCSNSRNHPLKNSLLIVTLSLAISACASNAGTVTGSLEPGIAGTPASPLRLAQAGLPNRASEVEEAASPETPGESLPHVPLTEDLLFRILVAELSFQNGDWQSAYSSMLDLARETGDPRLARRAAEVAHLARRQPEILTAVRLWRELAPQSEDANQNFLGYLIMSNDLAEAKPVLEHLLKQASPQGRIAQAFQVQRMLVRAKDRVAAFTLLEQVLTPYLDTPEIRLALAQGALASGDLARARKEARAALAAKPDSELAILSLAQATLDKDEASNLIADFLKRHPQAREVRLALARVLVEQKQYEKARVEFEHLLRDDPEDLTALYALGVLDMQTEKLDEAETYLTRYVDTLERNPDRERDPTQAMLLLAQIAEQRQDTESLLKWLGRIESGEAYVQAQIRRAQVIAQRGDLEAARELLAKVDPGSEREAALLVTAEAQMLRDAGQMDEAMRVFEVGLEHLPDNTELLYDYAMLAEQQGALDKMEKSLRKIIEIAPEYHHAYNALGYSLADRNIRLDEAHALIKKALELAPDDAFIIDSMGWVEYRMGRLDEAERLLRRAYASRPDAEIAAHLGEVLWVKGDREAAEQLWRDAQAKDPQNDTLKSTLARLNASP